MEPSIAVEFRPSDDLQIAVWLEDESGAFVDTLMVTRLVGTFGLGNRPGRRDFLGGVLWPYGRREMALPIWAHRRGTRYDRIVFQDCRESALGWHENYSSAEPFYCRPVTPNEMSVDTITCPTTRFNSDKGIPLRLVDAGSSEDCRAIAALPETSVYPPRNDLSLLDPRDWSGAAEFGNANTLDAVSRATPPGGETYRVVYRLAAGLAPRRFVIWIEANREFDANAHHDYPLFTDPQLPDYGVRSIGQPSVAWRVPFDLDDASGSAESRDYAGYGSPDGQDGALRPPDHTIDLIPAGSGAGRLLLLSGTRGEYRVRVTYPPPAVPPIPTSTPTGSDEPEALPPASDPCLELRPVDELRMLARDYHFVDLAFRPAEGASAYEVRYREGGGAIETDSEFVQSIPGPSVLQIDDRSELKFRIDRLRPKTIYTVAVRGYDQCQRASRARSIEVTTTERVYATVDACFIATAAYGSGDQEEVVELRRFRDRVLRRSEIGNRLIDLYYAASPPLAAFIREHEILRAMVRAGLDPLVWLVRDID